MASILGLWKIEGLKGKLLMGERVFAVLIFCCGSGNPPALALRVFA
jgi:hypothetical protein